jgi:plasmid stability protein
MLDTASVSCIAIYRSLVMTTLSLNLPPQLYQRLQDEAAHAGQSVESLVQAWLAERLASPKSERERAIAVLHRAGLVVEPSVEMKARAAQAATSLTEVQAMLDRAGGKPLSEVIIEQRGPKE